MDAFKVFLIITAACPVACAFIAKFKNKNPVSWFCWGIIFGIFALAILIVSPDD